ncbi:MAG: hypothetical protein IKO19_02375, partial [Candidatus Riflebacteria bacterium]|nr:hypothetical protein [Candidatus Riflebacteria bacterium]
MNKDRLFLLLTVFFSLVNCTLLASIDMKCDLCGKDIKVEGQHINKYFSDPNLSFEKDINLIYPMIFSFPTLVKCPHCYYISVPSEISNQANKEKIQNYINTHPELKEDLSNKPWMQYEHAAEMSILNSDPSIITARCYLLAAWVSNKEKPLDRFQIDELTKLIPTNILSSFLENPPITDFNHGPSNID